MNLVIAAAACAVLGVFLILSGLIALLRLRPIRFAFRTVFGMLLVSLGVLAGSIGVGMRGYRALTREDVAAIVDVRPIAAQRFEATFRVPERPDTRVVLAGDQIYVDAHVLKWTPLANMLGLHTAYELDRVAGRYDDIGQERSAARTIFALGEEKPVDLFGLRRRYTALAPLLDAEYGSGTFVPVKRAATFEIRISTTGLLIREVPSTRRAGL
ncbi:MAG: cation/multidrug efflux pump [Acidobacteria bacterium]|nr:cation/multidrug efflux pump [Acidobacteriota bacterium]